MAYEYVGTDGQAVYRQTASTNRVAMNFYMGSQSGGSGTYSLSGTGTLLVGGMWVGYNGLGAFVQSGGTVTSIASGTGSIVLMVVGSQAGSSGTYTLSGGTLDLSSDSGNQMAVGFRSAASGGAAASGSFLQSGGIVNVPYLGLGLQTGANGYYSLSGTGQLLVSSEEDIGASGNGTFVQSGGTHTQVGSGNRLSIGDNVGSGSYMLNGNGTLTVAGEGVVGYGGTGSFEQDSGSAAFNNAWGLTIGYEFPGSGSYLLRGGELSVPNLLIVGYNATGGSGHAGGSFIQTAGVATVGELDVGDWGSGYCSLTGTGQLNVAGANIGDHGSGTFVQSGGTYTDTAGTIVGRMPGASGAYALSGGIMSTPNLTVGGTATAAGGTGVLTISGGGMSVANTLKIWNTAGTRLTLSGGNLSAGAIDLSGNTSLFQWTGGDLHLTNVTSTLGALNTSGALSVGSSTGNAASVVVSSINVDSLTINATGSVSVAHGASPVISTTSSLTIAPGGKLDLSNNSLNITYGAAASPLATIRSELFTGYDGGKWDGTGIVTSVGDANHSIGYIDTGSTPPSGQPADTFELELAIPGDTTLKGSVNLTDLLTLVRDFGKTNADWQQGDFNYDGTVNLGDFLILARHFGGGLSSAVLASMDSSDRAQVQGMLEQVPEPSSVALLAAVGMLLPRRRRRRVQLSR